MEPCPIMLAPCPIIMKPCPEIMAHTESFKINFQPLIINGNASSPFSHHQRHPGRSEEVMTSHTTWYLKCSSTISMEMNTRWSMTHVELIPAKSGLGGHGEVMERLTSGCKGITSFMRTGANGHIRMCHTICFPAFYPKLSLTMMNTIWFCFHFNSFKRLFSFHTLSCSRETRRDWVTLSFVSLYKA